MTSPRPDTPSPQPLSRERERGSSARDLDRFLLRADWGVPANVHAFTTLRAGAGTSQAPFDSFNLGNARAIDGDDAGAVRSEEHTSELQSLMRISYAVFCLKKKHTNNNMS